jgi:hypothetical protein
MLQGAHESGGNENYIADFRFKPEKTFINRSRRTC